MMPAMSLMQMDFTPMLFRSFTIWTFFSSLDPISMATDTQCLNYQIPGGMLSNLISQLKMMNAIDKLDQALAETPKVRADLSRPPGP